MGNFFRSCNEPEDSADTQQNKQQQQQKQKQTRQLTQNEKSVIELKQTRDKMRHQRLRFEAQIQATEKEIENLIKNDKRDKAKFVFKQKQLYEKYLSTSEDKAMVIDKMIREVQQAEMDKDITDVMKNANQFLKDVQKTVNPEELQDVFLDLQEDDQNQEMMNEMFAQYGVNEDYQDEFNQLEAQVVGEQMEQVEKPQVDNDLLQQQQYQKDMEKQQQDYQNQMEKEQQKNAQQQEQQQNNKNLDLDEMLA
ncbi:hypothetical protein PPERSA_01963 [Pseudocohnilembus persalinus]|uniref:Snf7-domain-containing protein n=1 Tax=Pseudocohnilembus persalinus TaxID=266149 RepID=A0A0V0R3L5_PSEPJ|nr:hypothetical protein PPERSA_01963 [Pseudocohnilembus persalinus]|eukprot:KRX09076.1 hypothetical protein PPERSA_01963 [Pseudocohnilembus persalinus]